MALYTQRRRRTRSCSAWIGGPTVAAPTQLDPESLTRTRAQGSPLVSPQLRPASLVHTRTQGSPVVQPTLVPASLSHARAQGSPIVKPTIVTTGILHTRGIGTTALAIQLGPTGLSHTRAQGTPTLSPTVSPSGLSHTRAQGDITVSLSTPYGIPAKRIGRMTAPTGLGRARTPMVRRKSLKRFWIGGPTAAVQIDVASITHTRALGSTVVGAVLAPASITHSRAQGSPTVNPTLNPASITHTRAQGSLSVSVQISLPFVRQPRMRAAPGLGTRQARALLKRRGRRRSWVGTQPTVVTTISPAGLRHVRSSVIVGPPPIIFPEEPGPITVSAQLPIRQIGHGLVVTVAWVPRPTGIEHTRAQGSIVVTGRHVAPEGLSHTRAQGIPQLSARVIVTGLSRTRAQGSPSVNPRTASPASIAHSRTQGSHTVTLVKIGRPDSLTHSTRAMGSITVTGRMEAGPPSLVRARTQGTPILSGRALPLSTVHLRVQGSPAVNVRTLAPLAISRA